VKSFAPPAVTIPQTPSEWLLTRYDRVVRRAYGPQGDARRIRRDRGSNFDRNMFDVIDDHPGPECDAHEAVCGGDCIHWSGQASWSQPAVGDALLLDDELDSVLEEIA
jgi:hypothetical protein